MKVRFLPDEQADAYGGFSGEFPAGEVERFFCGIYRSATHGCPAVFTADSTPPTLPSRPAGPQPSNSAPSPMTLAEDVP